MNCRALVRVRFQGVFSVCVSLMLAACSGSSGDDSEGAMLEPLALEEGCNPLLVSDECLLPFPSDFFAEPDPSLPSGRRVSFQRGAKLTLRDRRSLDMTKWLPMDGFSLLPTVVTSFGVATSEEGWVGILDDATLSLSPDTSLSIVLDANSGEPVAHYVDLDSRASDLSRRMIAIRILKPLQPMTRYVVALHSVRDTDGHFVETPEGFRRIRDGVAKGDPVLEPLSSRYEEDIFPVLADAGLQRSLIQLAWDFTTGSEEHVTADMFRVRELTMQYLEQNTPAVQIDSIDERNDEELRIWRTIRGHVKGPLFLASTEPGTDLLRDEDGQVYQNGTVSFGFIAEIPISVRDSWEPGRITCFGHGFFGDRGATSQDRAILATDAVNAILVGIDWWGMSNSDETAVFGDIIGEPHQVMRFGDRVHQAMANWIVMRAAIQSSLLDLDAFRRPMELESPGVVTRAGQNNAGHLIYNPDDVYFFGGSQGHILGGVLAALEPEIERYILQVGGAGFGHMLFRAGPFHLFTTVIEQFLTNDPYDQQKFAAIAQRHFDRIDPAIYAPFVLERPLPGSPADRQVLLQIARGDNQVPNVASYIHARSLGVGVTQPMAIDVWDVEPIESDVTPSGMTVYDFGIDTSFYEVSDIPAEDNGVHGSVCRLPAAIRQIDEFLNPYGGVIHPCDGICDPE